jgi:hypothetical protein
MARNYRAEYDKYQGKPEQIKKRAIRNAARSEMEEKGVVSKGDGKDVGHAKALSKGGSNHPKNLRVESVNGNRSFARNKDGSMKSEVSRRGR